METTGQRSSMSAMQLALEALEDANDVARMEFSDEDYYSEAINALRQALETEQEPVAWLDAEMSQAYTIDELPDASGTGFLPLYTAPPKKEWVGLTDEDRNNLWRNIIGWGDPSHDDDDLMKAIEAKLKEKNT